MASENEKCEMLADILAEWRECIEAADPSVWNDERIAGLVKTTKAQQLAYLDRLEAALKREHSQSWHHREMEELILRHEKEVAELKRERDLAIYAYDPTKAGKSRAPDSSAYALEALKLPYYRPVGNMPAMRILWKKVIRLINVTDDGIGWDWNVAIAEQVYKLAQTALALPRRNCDVGTPEEQAKQMDAYCASYGERIEGGWRCENCPLCSIDRCDLVWAQMPYEESEAKK